MFDGVVTPVPDVLGICVGVLRDVTVLAAITRPGAADGFAVREVAVRRVSVRPLKVVDLQRRSLGVPAGTGVYIPSCDNPVTTLARYPPGPTASTAGSGQTQ